MLWRVALFFVIIYAEKGGGNVGQYSAEFSRAIDGKDAYSVWEIMDELLSVLQATNQRLFDGVMRKIEEI